MTSLFSYDLKRITVPLVILLAIAVALVLLLPAPFSPNLQPVYFHTTAFAMLSIATGWWLATRCLRDPPGVSDWVHSRGHHRSSVFTSRFLSGLVGIGVMASVMAALCIVGVRETVQTKLMLNGAWYPMVRYGELHVVRDFAVVSVCCYCTAVLLQVLSDFNETHASGRFRSGFRTFAGFVSVAAVGGCWQLLLLATWTSHNLRGAPGAVIPLRYALIAFGLSSTLVVVCTRFAYAEREIQG